MGGHGHGHEPPYKVPHYSTFKVDGIRQLKELEDALSKKGLKDPWIRNEVWRYNPSFGTKATRAWYFFGRGLPVGIALAGLTVAYSKFTGEDDHGHGHGEHH